MSGRPFTRSAALVARTDPFGRSVSFPTARVHDPLLRSRLAFNRQSHDRLFAGWVASLSILMIRAVDPVVKILDVDYPLP